MENVSMKNQTDTFKEVFFQKRLRRWVDYAQSQRRLFFKLTED